MLYADDVNIMGGSVHIIEKTPEALLVASKEIFLKVNADKFKYMFMSPDQNAERCQYVKFDDTSFDRVDEFRYMRTT